MKLVQYGVVVLLTAVILIGCGGGTLPVIKKVEPDFELTNQYGETFTDEDLEGKVYIADFFFTSCPTICPKMSAQMLRIYEEFKEDDRVQLLSFSIDPRHDTPEVLNNYATKLGVEGDRWYFLTGEKDKIYELAEMYMIAAEEDEEAPGGFMHSGAFVLTDGDGKVRSFCNGTDPKEVDGLMQDLEVLLNETGG